MELIIIALCIHDVHKSTAKHEAMHNPAHRHSENHSSESQQISKKEEYSILPQKIYSVIGFESSGEDFVAKTIQEALQIKGGYRNGSGPHSNINVEEEGIQVQCFSLPWGPKAVGNPNTPVLDVVLPSQCSRDDSTDDMKKQCAKMTNELWGFSSEGKVHLRAT